MARLLSVRTRFESIFSAFSTNRMLRASDVALGLEYQRPQTILRFWKPVHGIVEYLERILGQL